jgi:hypothetical protein
MWRGQVREPIGPRRNHLPYLRVYTDVRDSQGVTGPRKPSTGSLWLAAVFGACIIVVSACASSPSSQQKLASEPQATTTTSTSPSAAPHVVGRPGYIAARKEWLAEGNVIGSAGQSVPIDKALTDLERGEITDSGNKSGYPAIIAALKNFASIPDAMVTAAQQVEGRVDTVEIDKFFHMPGNLPCTRWPSSRKACWEPAVSHS